MKKLIKIFAIIGLSFFLLSCSEELVSQSQNGSLKGKVVKKGTNEPIANVKIFTAPSTNTVFSGTDGTFEITDMPVGDYSVKAEMTGYLTSFQAIKIQKENQQVTVVFELSDDDSANTPPTTPVLVSPIDNAEHQPLSVELKWLSLDPDTQDVLKYKLIVKNNINTNVLEINDINTNHYTLSNLQFGVSYFWQVSVSDGVHSEIWSPTFKFTTSTTPANRYHYVKKINGNSVIFSSDEQGNNFQLTNSSYNSWRPRKNNNSGLIAFLRTEGGSNHIFTVNPDGSNPFKVTHIPVSGFNANEMDFSWSTNGNSFIYSSFNKLYKINKDGSGEQLLYSTPDGSLISECDWSYDGSKIALKTNNFNGYTSKIYVIDMLGNVISNVGNFANGACGGLNFSVDGQKLLYTRDISGHEDGNYRQLDSRIFIYNFTDNTILDVSLNSDRPLGTNDLDARFSPNDSQIIVMNTSNDNISQKNIIKIDLNSTGTDFIRTVLFTNAEMPDFE